MPAAVEMKPRLSRSHFATPRTLAWPRWYSVRGLAGLSCHSMSLAPSTKCMISVTLLAGTAKSGTPSRVISIITKPPPGTNRDMSFISPCLRGSVTYHARDAGSQRGSIEPSQVLITTVATRPG